jgi:hypothetical protein
MALLRWNWKYARGIGGKRLFEGNGRDTRWIVSDFVRALNETTEVKMAWVSGWSHGYNRYDAQVIITFGQGALTGKITVNVIVLGNCRSSRTAKNEITPSFPNHVKSSAGYRMLLSLQQSGRLRFDDYEKEIWRRESNTDVQIGKTKQIMCCSVVRCHVRH